MNDDITKFSDEKKMLVERIRAYQELQMHKEAVDECKKLVSIDADDPESFIELGFSYEENGETEEAIKCYQQVIEKFPKYADAYNNLGYCYEKYAKRDDMAIVCYEKALALEPDNEWALNNTAVIWQRKGRCEDAVSYYEQSYEVCRQGGTASGKIMHNLAWAYYRVKKYKKSSSMFLCIAKEEPDYFQEINDSYADFGCVQYKRGLYGSALSFFEKATRIQPQKRRFQGLYKFALRKVGKYSNEAMVFKQKNQIDMMAELFIDEPLDDAKEYYLPSITAEDCLMDVVNATNLKEREEALGRLVLIYRARNTDNQGKYTAEARQDLIRIIEQNGKEISANGLIGEGGYCEKIRDYESAVDFYFACVRAPKTDVDIIYLSYNNLGFCLNFLKRFNEAEKYIRDAISVCPERYNAWKNLGVSLEWQGQYEEAAECYLTAVHLSSNEPKTQMHLQRILERHPTLRTIDCLRLG